MRNNARTLASVLAAVALAASACGGEVDISVAGEVVDAPTIAVTTNILGDIVENVVGGQVAVEIIMPVGADPHDFQPSAQQVAAMGAASALIVNGGDFEEGLLDVIETAEDDGVLIFEALSAVQTLEFAGDDEHGDDEHGHEGADPHFFTDPARAAEAAHDIADFLAENIDGLDTVALAASADEYVAELEALDTEVEQMLASIDTANRVLITNHEVFGYFADRYDFEVVGTIIPATNTSDAASAQELADLAELIEHAGVSAIFADGSASDELAQTLAAEVGDVDVVALFSESLGPADSNGATYIDMVRSNAERIAAALGA